MARRPHVDAPEVSVQSVGALRDWLVANHRRAKGVWLVTMKKGAPAGYIPVAEIVDTCLCFGWVDSLPRAKDDQRTMLYISPRKRGSNWSRVNRDKAARLTAEGLMHPAGLAAVEAAKADGSWSALDDVESLVIPPDLAAAFATQTGARENWEAFPRSVKRGALEILLNAKRPATRAAKIDQIVSDSAQNQRPFQWKGLGKKL
ncbi:YdeI/OmpD-associated family protein [Cognatiyoonia sp. IB215446]|uniref:YdeI/OmpD-associated family protein n=1 Tax=Cognatiyoonia sp. IB215446 TaxID=3097355 RepID=UPI002A11C09B|nr:YdeI/OmpD-associated family protein [Cognatiyoonia sp. IB215446]MDX8348022.1 YdeI/OmpD-associated family protein [Cognatiyoonia sp. IB215446]